MKKIISLILVLTLVMSMSVTAFAADNKGVGTGSYEAEVTGSYNAGGTGSTVYSVDITWSGLSFEYNAAGTQWNTTNHQYDTVGEAGWAESNGVITVTNHSNAAITATPSYKAADGYEEAGVTFGPSSLTVKSAADENKAESDTITVKPTGTLPEGTNNATIGTITIKIS